jgi:4-amino-4-deoxy-L-arabinose transferase-like glycosyltransferase
MLGGQDLKSRRPIQIVLFAIAAVFLFLHALHLRADFPNHSPWVDWAKYTDEGWYGDAAIRYYVRGAWHVPGDFNPAAALPVWPLLEGMLFSVTGVGVVPARALAVAVFAGIVAAVYVLMRRRGIGRETALAAQLSPVIAVVMLSVSPFLYAFGRMAILEPMLILLTLTAMWVAWTPVTKGRVMMWVRPVALGVLLALMIGTKTTAVCLIPAVLWMLWCGEGRGWRRFMVTASAAGVTAGAIVGTYFVLVIRPYYLADFKYLFQANQYTGITRATFWSVVGDTLHKAAWTGPAVCTISILVVVAALFRRRIWSDPLFTGCVLWISGYFAFLAYHASLQPRYYMVVAVPLTILAVRGAEDLSSEWRPAALVSVCIFAIVGAMHARETLHFVRHPQYSFADAAARVKGVVDAERGHSRMVLSISGSDLTLMTGLPSICDDFGTMELEDRIAAYKPGWFVAWNYVEDDKMDSLAKFYQLTRVAEFPAMDDPDRNLLIVYRLDAKKKALPGIRSAKRSTLGEL